MLDTTDQTKPMGKAARADKAVVLLRVPREVHDVLRRLAFEKHTSINRLANDELLRLSSSFSAQNQL
jgi:hypothetical protein